MGCACLQLAGFGAGETVKIRGFCWSESQLRRLLSRGRRCSRSTAVNIVNSMRQCLVASSRVSGQRRCRRLVEERRYTRGQQEGWRTSVEEDDSRHGIHVTTMVFQTEWLWTTKFAKKFSLQNAFHITSCYNTFITWSVCSTLPKSNMLKEM